MGHAARPGVGTGLWAAGEAYTCWAATAGGGGGRRRSASQESARRRGEVGGRAGLRRGGAIRAGLWWSAPWWQAAALGAIQGLTEFLPVSSSGHLVLLERVLGVQRPGLALEAGLHLGTLLAVVWAYRLDLLGMARGLGGRGRGGEAGLPLWLLVGSLPAGVAGALLSGPVERLFSSLGATAVAWCVCGALLWLAGRRPAGRRRLGELRLADALWIGVAQAFALAPGFSRSGATIAAGLGRGLAPEEAARFGFLLSLPAVGGAVLWHGAGMFSGAGGGAALWLGAAVAGAVGLLALRACVARVRTGALGSFGCYCLALGGLLLLRATLTGEWR